MSEKLFPERQRCKKCGKALGKPEHPTVFFGLFCTPRCAGIAVPSTLVQNAPRECKTQRDGVWSFKRRYRSVGEIPDRILEQPATSTYWCQHCGHLHVGRTLARDQEQFRMLQSPEDLADFLVKRRGGATHSQVAKAAGVQPIRVKELENPKKNQRVDIHVLFAVLGVLRARPGVAMEELHTR